MGGISKSANVTDGIEVDEESFFPDEELVKAKAELIYDNAYKMLIARQAADEDSILDRVKDPEIAEKVRNRIFECIYNYAGYVRGLFHLNDDATRNPPRRRVVRPKRFLPPLMPYRSKPRKLFSMVVHGAAQSSA